MKWRAKSESVVVSRSPAGDRPECSLCLEPLEDGDMVMPLRCSHVYHAHCVRAWFDHTRFRMRTCPLCKANPIEESDAGMPQCLRWLDDLEAGANSPGISPELAEAHARPRAGEGAPGAPTPDAVVAAFSRERVQSLEVPSDSPQHSPHGSPRPYRRCSSPTPQALSPAQRELQAVGGALRWMAPPRARPTSQLAETPRSSMRELV